VKPGPRPKPTLLRRLEGNVGHRPLRQEPRPRPLTPTCPGWLLPEAKREWRRVIPELEMLGLMTLVDRAPLAAYCQAYARWQRAEEYLQVHGPTITTASGYVQQRPEVAIARAERQAMHEFASAFGFSPSSRSRIDVRRPEEDPEDSLLDKVPVSW
jgi:P27 family predicted phage terminase small subunit